MVGTVEGAGVELAYEEGGAGPPVLLLHGMADDRTAWPAVPGARTIAYDRRGYGSSGAPEPYERTYVYEQTEDAVALASGLRVEGVVVVAADFSALVALDLAMRHPAVIRAAVLVDIPVFALVAEAMEALAAERAALEAALRDGGPAQAVGAWLELRGIADGARHERARRDAPAFFADFGGQTTLPLSRGDLRAVSIPVVLLDTPAAPPHVRKTGDAVAALVPAARRGGAEDPIAAACALL